jgi:nucleoside-diphosphate-sugar epimerase
LKKILIIGALGYLGSRLTDYLLEKAYIVTNLDIGLFQYGILYCPSPMGYIHKNAKEIDEIDIENHDVVILLAGISNDPFGKINPDEIYNPTREYAKRIALICKKLGKQFIFPSSCSVYGIAEGNQTEESEVNPQTHYSKNKIQIEEDLKLIGDKTFSPISLRLSTVFGLSPRIRFDVVINMLCGMAVTQNKIILNSNGLAWRPHVYIEDVCKVFEFFIENPYTKGDLLILNIGMDENNLRVIDVVDIIRKNLNQCELEYLMDKQEKDELVLDRKINDGVDIRNYKVSFQKLIKDFPNLRLEWTVEKGVLKTLEKLNFYKLSSNKFKQIDFYRLQHVEYLLSTNQLQL